MKKGLTKEKLRKCAKCGSLPADDSTVKLHRFPQPNKANKPRCELWAKFCFPNNAWQSPKFQNKLFREHKMLCDKHFKSRPFEKEKGLAKILVREKHHNEMRDNLADVEIVEIKNEPDEELTIIEHGFEPSPQLKSTTENANNYNSPKKTSSQPLKGSFEDSDVIHDSSKIIMDTWDVEPPEISPEDFDETYNEWFSQTSKNERNDDCQLYGKLLTKKLRTYSVYERNLIMYKIDGLLIENPPGFDTSSQSISTKTLNKSTMQAKQSIRKTVSSTSSTKEQTCSTDSNNVMSSSSSLKRKRMKKETSPEEVQISTLTEEPSIGTQVTSSSMASVSLVKSVNDIISNLTVTSSIPKQPVKVIHTNLNRPVNVTSKPIKGKSVQYQPIKVTSSIPNQPVKVKSSIPNQPLKVTSSIPSQPVKVTSSIPNHPVKVTSSIPNKPVKVFSIASHPPKSTSVPSHLPLQITIPETKLVPVAQSKFVASSSHPKGKIVVVKSKSAKFVPSSQPPILLTIPSLFTANNLPVTTQCDMNSLEQLSSIAVTRASEAQEYHTSLDSEEMEMADNMDVVSHEVVLSASSNSPLQNIVETALKYADIKDE